MRKLGLKIDYPEILDKDGAMSYQGSERVRFIGCGIETGGTWSPGLQKLFNRLVKLSKANGVTTFRTKCHFARRWRTKISIALQRSLARCVIAKANDIRADRKAQHYGPAAESAADLGAPIAAVPVQQQQQQQQQPQPLQQPFRPMTPPLRQQQPQPGLDAPDEPEPELPNAAHV